MNTPEYLDLLRKKLGLPSDYALQKPLAVSKSQLSSYRTGKDSLSDAMCVRVAELCNLPIGQVLLDAHIERSKTPEVKAAWRAMAEKISASFNALMLCTASCFSPMRDSAAT